MAQGEMREPFGVSPRRPEALLSASDRELLRHPLEGRIKTTVAILDLLLVAIVIGLLYWGAELLESWPSVGKYRGHAKLLLVGVLGAPIIATYARRRRRLLAQEESIRVSENQLPEVHDVLVRHCRRVGIPMPDLYMSNGVEHTTSFSWRGHTSIVVSTHDFESCPEAFDDVVDFAIAREVGSICLGHTSFASELLRSSVAPIPFLKGPLRQVKTYSCDRYGAVLAPRAIRALIVAACGDRLRNRVDLDAYLAQIDEARDVAHSWRILTSLMRSEAPLARRVQELRRAGLLTKC